MEGHQWVSVLVLAILVMLSAFFSASETAFSSLNRIRLKNMAEAGSKKAARALGLSEEYNRLLSTILIGNNIVNIASASLATVLFTSWFGDAGVSLSTVVMTVVVLIFGEISPKSMAKESPDSFAMLSAPVLKILTVILTPLGFLFDQWKKLLSHVVRHREETGITEEELKTIVDEVENGGAIDRQEGELIRSAIEFDDQTAGDILTPRVDIVAVEYGASLEEIADLFQENGLSRLPVYEETIDNIRGILHEKDFFGLYRRGGDIAGVLRPAVCVPVSMRIFPLLRRLQQEKNQMAVVIDEFGGTAGLLTMEDILEELVGDIWDEHDREVSLMHQTEDGGYAAAGTARLEELFALLGSRRTAEDYDSVTVNGWVLQELGRLPSPGAGFLFDGYRVEVARIERRRVAEVTLHRIPETSPDARKEEDGPLSR